LLPGFGLSEQQLKFSPRRCCKKTAVGFATQQPFVLCQQAASFIPAAFCQRCGDGFDEFAIDQLERVVSHTPSLSHSKRALEEEGELESLDDTDQLPAGLSHLVEFILDGRRFRWSKERIAQFYDLICPAIVCHVFGP